MSRPCGSRSGRPLPASDAAASASLCEPTPGSLWPAGAAARASRRAPRVMDRHQPVRDGDVDGLTVEPHPDRIQLGSETDLAGPTHLARRGRLRVGSTGSAGSDAARRKRSHGTTSPMPLMPSVVVVFVHPPIELGLRVSDRFEHFAVQELARSVLMPPLHLARRRRRPRRRQDVFDPVLAADPIKQHLTLARPEPPVNTLPLSVRISRGTP